MTCVDRNTVLLNFYIYIYEAAMIQSGLSKQYTYSFQIVNLVGLAFFYET